VVSRKTAQDQGMVQYIMGFAGLTLSQGLLETKALAFAECHATIWESFIVKPGGIVPKKVRAGG